jgi:hypothetical protein
MQKYITEMYAGHTKTSASCTRPAYWETLHYTIWICSSSQLILPQWILLHILWNSLYGGSAHSKARTYRRQHKEEKITMLETELDQLL